MLKWQVQAILTVCGVAGPLGCAQKEQKPYPDEAAQEGQSGGGGITSLGGGSDSRRLVTIPASLSRPSFGLLAAADSFVISLEGCASGYTSTADETSLSLQVYKYDLRCLAKLTTFTYNGKTYLPTNVDASTAWAKDDVMTYDVENGTGADAVTVKILSQLISPVSGIESVSYQFSELIKGADETLLEANVSSSSALTVASEDPPSFTIKSVELTEITDDGAGIFDFILECTADMEGSSVCEDVDLPNLRYKLVQDTYDSTLVIDEAHALFSSGTSATIDPNDYLLDPTGPAPNGGFRALGLVGPNEMALNRNMIFIIQASEMSYQYFNVDVATLTQNP